MNKKELLDEILFMLRKIKEDRTKLEKLHKFMTDEIFEEVQEKATELPEKYKVVIREIAQLLDVGHICYLNPETLEIVSIPKSVVDEYWSDFEDGVEEPSESVLEWIDEFEKVELWEQQIPFEPLETSDAFIIMSNFSDQLPESNLKNKLINALERKHPFRNFNNAIHNSDHRDQWFAFKQKSLEKHVYEQMVDEGIINKNG